MVDAADVSAWVIRLLRQASAANHMGSQHSAATRAEVYWHSHVSHVNICRGSHMGDRPVVEARVLLQEVQQRERMPSH